jgi:hypothetical protein
VYGKIKKSAQLKQYKELETPDIPQVFESIATINADDSRM